MGRLTTFGLLAALLTTGPTLAGEGEPPKAEPAGEAKPRPEPPAPPRKYLEAGANLFNKGQYELAARYLLAAHMYRDRLKESERVVLDVYRGKLDQYQKRQTEVHKAVPPDQPPAEPGAPPPAEPVGPPPAEAGTPTANAANDPGVVTASTASRGALPARDDAMQLIVEQSARLGLPAPPTGAAAGRDPYAARTPVPNLDGRPTYGSETWRDTTDSKQKGRWLLQLAREQIKKQNYDLAEQAIAEARALDVQWSLFDETPERMTQALEKARGKGGRAATAPSPALADAGNSAPPAPARDRKAARARLREARAALAAGDPDRADAIAREVKAWGVSYGLFDDTPDKVTSAVFESRRREAVRNAELMVRSYYRDGTPPAESAPAPPAEPDRSSPPN